ncbi:hypothetical protein BvCmsSIP065_02834 [Escherichia coli]|nr:hypothetical protein BvCms28BK_05176 [Escherichia coli]GCI09041.1 hypothetical protein BvCmsSIP0822_05040 [Escherichia coli]GDI92952.1 hypothetical protein BvCmsKKP029_02475 [Escherichia coli]GDR57971.1 hypothetical protein BvCmsNSP078_04917 [Escherichia coli]GDV39984.1 hypothetical protein BvCmsSIP065_02834 [Escherichia coli]
MPVRRHCAVLNRWWKRWRVTRPWWHRTRQPRRSQPVMPAHLPVRRQPMRLMLQIQHVQPARQPDRPLRRLSQRLPAQERHQQRPLKRKKVLPLQSPQKARQLPVPLPRKRQNECCSVTTISRHFCIHRDHESVRSCHLSPGCVGFKRGGKIIRNERILERQ